MTGILIKRKRHIGRMSWNDNGEIAVMKLQGKKHKRLLPPSEARKRQKRIIPRVSELNMALLTS